jgi:transcriptional regulator with XRE-family HTH domain
MIIAFPTQRDMRLGSDLRRIREARGVSLGRLAKESRLEPARLTLAEQGRAHLSSAELHSVINALHIPLELLFQAPDDLSRLRKL